MHQLSGEQFQQLSGEQFRQLSGEQFHHQLSRWPELNRFMTYQENEAKTERLSNINSCVLVLFSTMGGFGAPGKLCLSAEISVHGVLGNADSLAIGKGS